MLVLTLYTVSAAVSLGTFHRPKPTRGISLPEARVVVDFAIVVVVVVVRSAFFGTFPAV